MTDKLANNPFFAAYHTFWRIYTYERPKVISDGTLSDCHDAMCSAIAHMLHAALSAEYKQSELAGVTGYSLEIIREKLEELQNGGKS